MLPAFKVNKCTKSWQTPLPCSNVSGGRGALVPGMLESSSLRHRAAATTDLAGAHGIFLIRLPTA